MLIKKLDENRDITSSGYVIQRKKVRGRGKPAGSVWLPAKDSKGYRRLTVNGTEALFHRIVWETFNGPIPEGSQIDHINGDRGDNRLENLRLATREENCRAFNKPQGGASKHRGVYWNKSTKKWHAKTYHKGKQIHVGLYDCEDEAALARDNKCIELGWPAEGLNFPL